MKNLKKNIAFVLAFTLGTTTSMPIVAKTINIATVLVNSMIYNEEIDKYNKYIQEYASYINSLNLTDMEIIMKVMKDIWNEIDGYGDCKNLIQGYYRLAFQEEGRGVCTSFADDFTARINAINSKYDAKNIIVYMNELKSKDEVKTVDIEKKVLGSSKSVLNSIEMVEAANIKSSSNSQNSFGNHMVSLISIEKDNLYLVVDVTNLVIGVLKNGEIKILNCKNEDVMDYKFLISTIFSQENYYNLFKDYFDTFEEPTITDEEIENLYGYKAQEEALVKVKKMEVKTKKLK